MHTLHVVLFCEGGGIFTPRQLYIGQHSTPKDNMASQVSDVACCLVSGKNIGGCLVTERKVHFRRMFEINSFPPVLGKKF